MDINPGLGSSDPRGLTDINGTLYFAADDGRHGFEPWTVDVANLFETVSIDIKRDVVNVDSNGSIAVSILTTLDFDASLVDITNLNFAGASAFQWALDDVDNDGDLDLMLHFRIEDTILDSIFAQLVADDLDGDGVLDSKNQEAEVSLMASLFDGSLVEGSDSLDLTLRGLALRKLLDEIFT
jgi:hypothetical protein